MPPTTTGDGSNGQTPVQWQRVLKHYLSQILFGCKNPKCTTPTCRTYNERSSMKPFRPPTELTARALAYYLTSLDSPTQGLCPHALERPSDNLEIDVQQRRGRKDPKSLGQNLFDTEAIYRSLYAEGPIEQSADGSQLDLDMFPDFVLGLRNGTTMKALYADRSPRIVFTCLWSTLEPLFRSPPVPSQNSDPDLHCADPAYPSEKEAAHVIFLCFGAMRAWALRGRNEHPTSTRISEYHWEREAASRLADRLLRGIGARTFYEYRLSSKLKQGQLMEIVIDKLVEADMINIKHSREWIEEECLIPHAFDLLWANAIKDWDGKGTVQRWTKLGVLLQLVKGLYTHVDQLEYDQDWFEIPELEAGIDPVQEAADFLEHEDSLQPDTVHLFDYPFVFGEKTRVRYFRLLNATLMDRDFARRKETRDLKDRMESFGARRDDWATRSLEVTLQKSLVLHVPRHNILEATFAQLRGYEKRLFLKPLKTAFVGELALDTGGVTPEFFNTVLRAAFQPAEGMFTNDPLYFQPASRQPAWKFELLGLILSLAVYNGIPLPFTFPLAFYHNLLIESSSISPYPDDPRFIEDGWPGQARSFTQLLSFTPSQVASAELHYCFPFRAYGEHVEVDMKAFSEGKHSWPARGKLWPADCDSERAEGQEGIWGKMWPEGKALPPLSSPAWRQPLSTESNEEIPLVTYENRRQFVKDYIFWLTAKSVAPQLSAFRRGFRTCLHPKALRLLTPKILKQYVEGEENVDVEKLKRITIYNDKTFDSGHPTVQDFWSIVEGYDMEDRRRLFKFVTAFERVPMTGMDAVVFEIAYSPYPDRLPISRTCIGRLELPAYKSKEELKEKLDMAIREGNEGFGFI
ncbi:uncharacterized protein EI97DRAFT_466830 [Westerdykella ornata]|uniref:HECT-type E3 ubiquitin transferase n=1 Tax=Westerdykella ornata TaxID=318751 RepID=A0A6A6JKP4_WESOR|nr:uncharacterized protein EI97DRAFT_466830 [Westerdykella ornata]KAF2276683.1 hypothetical protein EI97DRAFT_466830 [Westerdykella ornata]